MAPASLRFLDLPAEIRCAIYDAYVAVDGGYTVNPLTNKLVAANGHHKHDYALQLTCKQIAREMSGLALRRNTLHFKVEYSDEERISAARFEAAQIFSQLRLMRFLRPEYDTSGDDLDSEGDDSDYAGPELTFEYTQEIVDEVVREFPAMRPFFYAASKFPRSFGDIDMSAPEVFGVPISLLLKAAWRTYELALEHGSVGTSRTLLSYLDGERVHAAFQEFLPWHYNPSRKDFAKMVGKNKQTRRLSYRFWLKPHIDGAGWRQDTLGKYKFSAASKAIRFLLQCPKKVRMQLRRICLHETSISVAFPECHAIGLIPFCQENPRLCVERRVNVWRTLCRTGAGEFLLSWQPERVWEYVTDPEIYAEESLNGARLSSERLSLAFARWMMEAVELVRLGMPRRSFKLVFDGDSAPQLASRLFRDVFQRAATWQKVHELEAASWSEIQNERYLKRLSLSKHHSEGYFFDGFADMVDAIATNEHELVQCAFETGPSPWDETAFYRQFRGLKTGVPRLEAIADAYYDEPVQFFDLPHPLPPWKDIIAEDILPEFFDSSAELEQIPVFDWHDHWDEFVLSSDFEHNFVATSDEEGDSDDETPSSEDSEAAEDARSDGAGEFDD